MTEQQQSVKTILTYVKNNPFRKIGVVANISKKTGGDSYAPINNLVHRGLLRKSRDGGCRRGMITAKGLEWLKNHD